MERAEAEAILDGDRESAVALLMRIGELVEANRRLEARVAELEQRLNRSSRNSSLPPSQDPAGFINSTRAANLPNQIARQVSTPSPPPVDRVGACRPRPPLR